MQHKECPFCHGEFDFEYLNPGVQTPRVFTCPLCTARWRESAFSRDSMPPIHTVVEPVGRQVRATTRAVQHPQQPSEHGYAKLSR